MSGWCRDIDFMQGWRGVLRGEQVEFIYVSVCKLVSVCACASVRVCMFVCARVGVRVQMHAIARGKHYDEAL